MINILPIEEKKKNLTEYRLRLAVVSIFTITILLLVNLILLIPSYLMAVSKESTVARDFASQQAKQDIGGQEGNIDTQVGVVNKEIALFLSGGNTNHLLPADTIKKIIGMKSPAIKILGFDYVANGPQEQLVISGVAADRDSLSNFVDTLKGASIFTGVDLPVSSYVKSTDITFSISATRMSVMPAVKK